MEFHENQAECSCGLTLGVDELSVQDVLNSQEQERKHELVNQAIHFLGACNSSEKCSIKEKINSLKNSIREYYFAKENKLIAIPNQIALPKNPNILIPEETDTKKQSTNSISIDKYCEDVLHLAIINTLRKLDYHSFVMNGFQSGDCLQAKIDKGKQLRKDLQCNCKHKTECKCGKPKNAELNDHEKDVMEILDIEDMKDEELKKCTQLLHHYKLKEADRTKPKPRAPKNDQTGITSWLFNKVNIL